MKKNRKNITLIALFVLKINQMQYLWSVGMEVCVSNAHFKSQNKARNVIYVENH